MIELNPVFRDILTTDKRIVIITGGRGSSKSFSTSTIASLLTYEKGNRILYTRYTLTSARISIIPEFVEKIELLEVPHHFDINQTQIVNNQTGSDIIFRGIRTSSGNQTANLKSIQGITVWILDEAEELTDQNTFDKINLSIRAATARNLIILVLNPTTISHWIWTEYFESTHTYKTIEGIQIPISTHPDVLHIHTTYLDNIGNLAPSFVDQVNQIKETNPDKYSHRIVGSWQEQSEGAIFTNWSEGEFDDSLPYCYGLDPGFFPDPLALVKVAVDQKKKIIYISEEIYQTELSNEDVVSIVKNRIRKPTDLIVCDTSEPRLIQNLRKNRINVIKAEKGSDSIITGIRAIQDYIIKVTAESFNVKKELRLYEWNDRKSSIPIDANNHSLDALRYAFRKLTAQKMSGVRRRN